MKHSTDYHDYVFKNSKLIGEFEHMYKYAKDIPWHQNKTVYSVFSDIDIAVIKQFKYDSVCEVGCGLGYFLNRLYNELKNGGNNSKFTGIDISQTAIKKAQTMFPEICFLKGDLLKNIPIRKKSFDLVIAKETLWYVCHKIDIFLGNMTDMVKDGGFFYISQSFPETEKWVGQDVIDAPATLKKILLRYGKPVHYCVEWDWNINGRPLVHFLGRVKR